MICPKVAVVVFSICTETPLVPEKENMFSMFYLIIFPFIIYACIVASKLPSNIINN